MSSASAPVSASPHAHLAGFRVCADDGAWVVTVRHRRPTPERPSALVHVHVATRLPGCGAVDIDCVAYDTVDGVAAMDLRVVLAHPWPNAQGLDAALRVALAPVLPRLARLASTSAACGRVYARLGALPVRLGPRLLTGVAPDTAGTARPMTIHATWRGGRARTLEVSS